MHLSVCAGYRRFLVEVQQTAEEDIDTELKGMRSLQEPFIKDVDGHTDTDTDTEIEREGETAG